MNNAQTKTKSLAFVALIQDYLVHAEGAAIIDSDGDPNTGDTIYLVRLHPNGLTAEMKVPEIPTFFEAQEWCLMFLGRPLHEVLARYHGRCPEGAVPLGTKPERVLPEEYTDSQARLPPNR